MTFDYSTLKKWAKTGDKLGNWNGKPVFSCSASELKNKGNGAYYIVYDDDNKIVGLSNGKWYSYGNVSKQGNVTEYSTRRNYNFGIEAQMTYGEKMPVAAAKAEVTYASESSGYDKPVGDVKMELDVETTLKMAREISIDDLLKGFNYGLE